MSQFKEHSDESLQNAIINNGGVIQQAMIAELHRRHLAKIDGTVSKVDGTVSRVHDNVSNVHSEVEKVKEELNEGLKPLEKIERDSAETKILTRWILVIAGLTLVVMVGIEIWKAFRSDSRVEPNQPVTQSPISKPQETNPLPIGSQLPQRSASPEASKSLPETESLPKDTQRLPIRTNTPPAQPTTQGPKVRTNSEIPEAP